MTKLYPFTVMLGGSLLIAWRVLRRDAKPVQLDEEPEDYGTIVAPTG